MIVYNHGRRWFTLQADAMAHRRWTANPAPVIKVRVESREDIAALLNALCEPPETGQEVAEPASPALVERAYVPIETNIPDCVPRFLLDDAGKKEWDLLHLGGEK